MSSNRRRLPGPVAAAGELSSGELFKMMTADRAGAPDHRFCCQTRRAAPASTFAVITTEANELQRIPVKLTHSRMSEVVTVFCTRKCGYESTDEAAQITNAPLGKFSQIGFEFAERQLNWVEVWRVRRQILDSRTAGLDRLERVRFRMGSWSGL